MKTPKEYHFIPRRTPIIKKTTKPSVSKDMEKLEPSYTAGGYLNRCRWCGNYTSWWFLKTLNTQLSYEPTILLLSICPRKFKAYVHV